MKRRAACFHAAEQERIRLPYKKRSPETELLQILFFHCCLTAFFREGTTSKDRPPPMSAVMSWG